MEKFGKFEKHLGIWKKFVNLEINWKNFRNWEKLEVWEKMEMDN